MQNAMNMLRIVLYVMEFITKHKMSRSEAAATTAGKLGISISEVLDVIAKHLIKKK